MTDESLREPLPHQENLQDDNLLNFKLPFLIQKGFFQLYLIIYFHFYLFLSFSNYLQLLQNDGPNHLLNILIKHGKGIYLKLYLNLFLSYSRGNYYLLTYFYALLHLRNTKFLKQINKIQI